ncbi:MAG: Dyp-type peroxidase [Nocardioidaceae bacterium]
MRTQPGIFALGTSDHCYLDFDVRATADPAQSITAAAELVAELSTTAGVNVVVGVRPSLWQSVAALDDVPERASDWQVDLVGPDGFTMPATQHDLWLWISGGSRTATFDSGRTAIDRLGAVAALQHEVTGWLYRHDRDLTGFIDGTENPSLLEAPAVVATPQDRRGAGSSIVLVQLWRHETGRWEQEPTATQERAMGRRKADSTELSEQDMPPDAHVARTVIEVNGEELDIFRRNVAYGGVTDHGTVFVGFSHDQWRMTEMLRRMAGIGDGVRCALTRYLVPLTGAYYVVPSVEALAAFATEDAG